MAKCSFHRAKFLLESVEDLRGNLQRLGSNLSVFVGSPHEVLERVAKEEGWTEVNLLYHTEVCITPYSNGASECRMQTVHVTATKDVRCR
jgi:deoxyribodipyrimidine photolyase